jgi:hypothetical protein
MKTRQVVFGLVGIIGLLIAFEVGRRLQASPPRALNANNRLITISASPPPDTGKCEVDFPVVFLRHRAHSIQWASSDNKYWVSFLNLGELIPGYTPENPLDPLEDPVVVDPNNTSKKYHVKLATKYYMYAIFDHDPNTDPNHPCKKASEDHDTGLNVKP